MELTTTKAGSNYIIYDEEAVRKPNAVIFDSAWWHRRGAVTGSARGRGEVVFVNEGSQNWAIRHYRRGGMVAKVNPDHYVWRGFAKSRPCREFELTSKLYELALPVPRPVAARAFRAGARYTADIITHQIPGATSLADLIRVEPLPKDDWLEIGIILRRFHDVGVDHADLNAHNILRSASGAWFVIDFDRGAIREPGKWAASNLARLHRSLTKLSGGEPPAQWTEADWQDLQQGYGTDN